MIGLKVFFSVAAVVCFAIGLLCIVGGVAGDQQAWGFGGLLALALSFVVP